MKKVWRIYEIIDIDTGEIYKKVNNKEFKTIKIEKNESNQRGFRIETTRRIVKHNGQKRLWN